MQLLLHNGRNLFANLCVNLVQMLAIIILDPNHTMSILCIIVRYLRSDCQLVGLPQLRVLCLVGNSRIKLKPNDLKLLVLVVLRDDPSGLDKMLEVMNGQLADVAL
jgi:hypothetical protein